MGTVYRGGSFGITASTIKNVSTLGILWFKTNGVFKINKKLMMHHLN
jgi:hypothetical protein